MNIINKSKLKQESLHEVIDILKKYYTTTFLQAIKFPNCYVSIKKDNYTHENYFTIRDE